MPPDLRDLLEQAEADRAELLSVTMDLAGRLRAADLGSPEEAAREIQAKRAGLDESPLLEAGVRAEILGAIVAALLGEE